jgi:hypothetical protein
MTRVPNYRRNMENMAGKIIKNVMLRVTADQMDFERKLKKYEKVRGKKFGEFVRKYVETAVNDGFVKKEFSNFSLEMIDLAREFAEVFNAMSWSFLMATDAQKFITSDNPVYYYDPTYQKGFDGVGLLNDNTEVIFPVSKDLALMANWKNLKGYYQLKNVHIRLINKKTVIFAQKYIFASYKSSGISLLTEKYKNNHPDMVVAS